MSEIMMEVEDALRAEKLQALWARYGGLLIGFVIGTILLTTGFVIWRNVMDTRYADQSKAVINVLQSKATAADTAGQLNKLAPHTNTPLRYIAEIYAAQKYEEASDLAAAQKKYQDVMTQQNAAKSIKDLSTIHFVRLGLLLKNDPAALMPKIDALTTDAQQPFYGSAMELKGLLLREQGKQSEANNVFNTLSTTSNVPATLRNRAKSLIVYEQTHAQ